MKILHILLALLFALFAYFQINDPDNLGWIGLYIGVAVLFGLSAFGRYFAWAKWGIALILLIGIITYAPGVWEFFTNDDGISFSQGMSNTYPYIEEAREFGGLTIALILVLTLIRPRSNR